MPCRTLGTYGACTGRCRSLWSMDRGCFILGCDNDEVGNRSGVVSWGFDHDRKRWWIKRKVGPIEWYKRLCQFQSFTKVDLTELLKAPYVDDKPGGPEYGIEHQRTRRECGSNQERTPNLKSDKSKSGIQPRVNTYNR
ncbi:hypothetical protein Hanom_Chr03g00203921 [Helianthus anomalus]